MARQSGISIARARFGLPDPVWRPNPQDPNITLGTLIERRASYTRQWLGSDSYQVYADFFKNVILQSENIVINQAMCLGLGSLSDLVHDDETSTHESGMMQLVAFESWLDLLEKNFTFTKVYMQDPGFTDLDKEFLETHGFTVIESPESEAVINEQTFLYFPWVEKMIINSCLSHASPPLMINAGDLGWHYKEFRKPDIIRKLLEKTKEDPNDDIGKLLGQPDEGYDLRIAYTNERAVEYLPAENPGVTDESLAIYWTPQRTCNCTPYLDWYTEYLTPEQARKCVKELVAAERKKG